MLFNNDNIEAIQLKSLLRITRAISHVRDLHSLITLLASETSKVLDVERSTVFLYSPKTDELWSYVAEGESEEIRFSASQGIAGSVLRSMKTLILHDVCKDQRFNKTIDKTTGFITRNMITARKINSSRVYICVFQGIN
ncbi:MAG: GAF domain-containing protein [Candidatus Aegiribacteria sp.]|nr:GAF domain-containing protein [Candidatus Aegiribacteria sp.]